MDTNLKTFIVGAIAFLLVIWSLFIFTYIASNTRKTHEFRMQAISQGYSEIPVYDYIPSVSVRPTNRTVWIKDPVFDINKIILKEHWLDK